MQCSVQVEQSIDKICALGCKLVNAYIAALENAESRPEYAGLDDVERASLLSELQAIMAVYKDTEHL